MYNNFLRRKECQKYKQWREQQARKSSAVSKKVKKKKNQELADCLDEDKKEEIETNVSEIKAPDEGRKKGKRKQWIGPDLKEVSLTDILLERIKPSIDEREKLLNHRHINCLVDETLNLNPVITKTTTMITEIRDRSREEYTSRKGRRKEKNGRTSQKKDKVRKDATQNPEADDKSQLPKPEELSETQTAETSGNEAEKFGRKGKKRKKKTQRKKSLPIKADKSISRKDSECSSVCSFDSDICLAGLVLTAKDKEQIKKYQKQG